MSKIALWSIAAGLLGGLVGALCGVGGGIVMVPIFTNVLGLGQKQAVATSLAVIIVISLTATILNYRATHSGPLINWTVFGFASLGAVLASMYGTGLMQGMKDELLTRIFALCLIAFGVIKLIWPK